MLSSYLQETSKGQITPGRNPDTRKRQISCIPNTLTEAVPQCASSCIQEFVSNNYGPASCSEKQSLDFLCTHNSGTGLTVGEAGLQCVVSDCTGTDFTQIGVYNICAGVVNAIPETVGTITATLDPMEPLLTLSPSSSTSDPTSTENVSSIVMATCSPSIPTSSGLVASISASTTLPEPRPTPIPILTPSSTTPINMPDSQSTSTAAAYPTQSRHRGGITTAQIAGISVAGFASVSLAFALLLFLFCRRKKRARRRRSRRWSIESDRHPPTVDVNDSSTTDVAPDSAALSGFNPHQRYSTSAPIEQARRSFWRKSIKPEEIGVAVSPEAVQQASPTSISSQRTTSKLLPIVPEFPAPVNIDSQEKQQVYRRRQAPAAILAGEIGRNSEVLQPYSENAQQNMSLESRSPTRQRLAALALNNDQPKGPPPNASTTQAFRSPRKSGRMPLTPTYDNGNFSTTLPLANLSFFNPGTNIGTSNEAEVHTTRPRSTFQAPSQTYEPNLREQDTQPPQGPIDSQIPRRSSSLGLRNQDRRVKRNVRSSVATDTTFFEDDSTPEQEIDNELAVAPLFSAPVGHAQSRVTEKEASPIRDLMYPRMPRPAAMSRQAEKAPQPRTSNRVSTALGASLTSSRRDSQVRANLSFIQSDSTSQSRDSSSDTTSSSRRGDASQNSRLRTSTSNQANWMWNMKFQASEQDDVFVDGSGLTEDSKPKQTQLPVTSPPPQAMLTPNRTRDGDLYLTVDA